MKRLSQNKAREMLESKLIEELAHIHLEGKPEVNSVRDCERVIERAKKDIMQISFSPDYYRIGSYLNIKRANDWTHYISVFYYKTMKGGNEKWQEKK
jgi:hypothetical protein